MLIEKRHVGKVFILPTEVVPGELGDGLRIVFDFPGASKYRGLAEKLENPLLDPSVQHHAKEYVERCNEIVIKKLSVALNELHNEKYPSLYWEMLFGRWMVEFLSMLYGRYIYLKLAIEKYGKENVVLYSNQKDIPALNGLEELFSFTCTDENGSSALYGEIARILGVCVEKVEEVEAGNHAIPFRAFSGSPRLYGAYFSTILLKLLEKTKAVLRKPKTDLPKGARILVDGYFDVSRNHLNELDIPGGIDEFPEGEFQPEPVSVDRRKIADLSGDDEFQEVVFKLLAKMTPSGVLEEYRSYRNESEKWAGYQVYCVNHAWCSSDPLFRFALARGMLRGASVLSCQHGGGFGQFMSLPGEYYARRVSHYFLTWGWEDEYYKGASLLPISLPKFAIYNSTGKAKGTYLYISTSVPGYLTRILPYPSTPMVQEIYLSWKRRFFVAMKTELHKSVIYRPYLSDYGWTRNELDVIKQFKGVVIDNGLPLMKMFGSASLVICDHLSTTFLEAMALNLPTIGFWNRGLTLLRDKVEGDFETLRRTGILFDTPEGAAGQINHISGDVNGWWTNAERQKVRKEFADKYCKVDSNWRQTWSVSLRGILGRQPATSN